MRQSTFLLNNSYWTAFLHHTAILTQKGHRGWGWDITQSYLGSKGGRIGGIDKGRREKRVASPYSIFPWILTYIACPCPTVRSYPLPSSSGKQDLSPTHGLIDTGLVCTSRRGLSSGYQRHRLFPGIDHPTRGGQRKVTLLSCRGPGEGCLQPGTLAGSMAEGHLPAAAPFAAAAAERLPNHFLCLSLPSSHFPSFFVSPLTGGQWMEKEYPYTYTTSPLLLQSALSHTHTHAVLPFLCIIIKFTKRKRKGTKS